MLQQLAIILMRTLIHVVAALRQALLNLFNPPTVLRSDCFYSLRVGGEDTETPRGKGNYTKSYS